MSTSTFLHLDWQCFNDTSVFRFARLVTLWLPLLMSIAWLMPYALLVKNIVHEKEQRLKEVHFH